jgi:hypothetical protein
MLKFNLTRLELKYESKDLLLVQVWHRDRAIPYKTYVLGVSYLLPSWRVSLAELYLLRLCLVIVLYVCSLFPFRRDPFLTMASLGQGAALDC